jgi:hypothetical protein
VVIFWNFISHPKGRTFIVRFEVFTAVKMSMLFLWVVTSCRYQRFEETYCLHLQGLKRWYLPTSLHGVTTQKIHLNIDCAREQDPMENNSISETGSDRRLKKFS